MTDSPHIVSDVMTHTAVAIGSHAPYKEIVQLMAEWKVSALPVLAGEGRVVGVVSEADLLPKEALRRDEPGHPGPLDEASKAGAVLAEDLMSSPAVTVHADATIAEAAQIMARKRVKRLPVVNDLGLLEGVVSRETCSRCSSGRTQNWARKFETVCSAGSHHRFGSMPRWRTVSSLSAARSGTGPWCLC